MLTETRLRTEERQITDNHIKVRGRYHLVACLPLWLTRDHVTGTNISSFDKIPSRPACYCEASHVLGCLLHFVKSMNSRLLENLDTTCQLTYKKFYIPYGETTPPFLAPTVGSPITKNRTM